MKALFVHDHIFKYRSGTYYSSGGLPASVWSRYTSIVDCLTVVGRDGGVLGDKEQGFSVSSTYSVRFELLPSAANLRTLLVGNKHAEGAARNLIDEHDALIVRLPSRLGVLFIAEAIKKDKPYAIEVVGCPWDAHWNYGGLSAKLFAPYAALEMKRVLRKSRFTLYVTEHFLQSRYPSNSDALTVVCSNVEVPAVANEVLTRRLERIAGLSFKRPVVFGQIANYSSKYKGIDVAIKALKEAKLPNWRLEILGSGDAAFYRGVAEELGVEDHVDFVGSLPSGDAVYKWIDSLDVYLHPSLTEGLPRALVEAMSRGAPVLASKVGGIPELLSEKDLVAVGDYKALARKLEALLDDRCLQATIAQRNFNRAKDYYKEVLANRRNKFWRQFIISAGDSRPR